MPPPPHLQNPRIYSPSELDGLGNPSSPQNNPAVWSSCRVATLQQPSHRFGSFLIRERQHGEHLERGSEVRLDRLGRPGGRFDTPHRSGIRPPFSSFRRFAGANAGANRQAARRNF